MTLHPLKTAPPLTTPGGAVDLSRLTPEALILIAASQQLLRDGWRDAGAARAALKGGRRA